MKILSTLFLINALFFFACSSKSDKNTSETRQTIKAGMGENINLGTKEDSSTVKKDLLATLPVRHFPIIDSTNFDNFETFGVRDNGFLKRIKFDPKRKDATNFRLNYAIPFSKNFTAVVFSYLCGDHELFTVLITIDKESKIIDKLEIAYDEIAESAFGKTSKIEKDKIVVTSSNWMSEEPVFESQMYIIQSNGKFKKTEDSSR